MEYLESVMKYDDKMRDKYPILGPLFDIKWSNINNKLLKTLKMIKSIKNNKIYSTFNLF